MLSPYLDADCVWGSYGEWSECSATCAGGTRRRVRVKTTKESGTGTCDGDPTETVSCNSDISCPPGKQLLAHLVKYIYDQLYYYRTKKEMNLYDVFFFEMQPILCAKVIQVDVENGKIRILGAKEDSTWKEDTALNNV